MEILNQMQGKENIYTTSQVYAYIQENLLKEQAEEEKNIRAKELLFNEIYDRISKLKTINILQEKNNYHTLHTEYVMYQHKMIKAFHCKDYTKICDIICTVLRRNNCGKIQIRDKQMILVTLRQYLQKRYD